MIVTADIVKLQAEETLVVQRVERRASARKAGRRLDDLVQKIRNRKRKTKTGAVLTSLKDRKKKDPKCQAYFSTKISFKI